MKPRKGWTATLSRLAVPAGMAAYLGMVAGAGGPPTVLCVGPYPSNVCACVNKPTEMGPYLPAPVCGGVTCMPYFESEKVNYDACASVGYTEMENAGSRTCKMFVALDCTSGGACNYGVIPVVTRTLMSRKSAPNSPTCNNPNPCIDPPPCPPFI